MNVCFARWLTQIFYTVVSQPQTCCILNYVFSTLKTSRTLLDVQIEANVLFIHVIVLWYYWGRPPLLQLLHPSSDWICTSLSPLFFLAVMKCSLTVKQKYSALNSKVDLSVVRFWCFFMCEKVHGLLLLPFAGDNGCYILSCRHYLFIDLLVPAFLSVSQHILLQQQEWQNHYDMLPSTGRNQNKTTSWMYCHNWRLVNNRM